MCVGRPRPSDLGPIVPSARPARIALPGGRGAAGGEREAIHGTLVPPPGAPELSSTYLFVCFLYVFRSFCLCLYVWLSVSVMCVCLSVCLSLWFSKTMNVFMHRR